MAHDREPPESVTQRRVPRRARAALAHRRPILGVLALAVAAAAFGLAIYLRRPSSATPAAVMPASPATPLAAVPPVYPLKIGPTGRYLVDRDGRPFLIVGDSPQALVVNLSPAQANPFLADRQA